MKQRLIDANALRREVEQIECHGNGVVLTILAINRAPTIDINSCDGCRFEPFGSYDCYHCARNYRDRYERKEN